MFWISMPPIVLPSELLNLKEEWDRVSLFPTGVFHISQAELDEFKFWVAPQWEPSDLLPALSGEESVEVVDGKWRIKPRIYD
jgi:hypothetical protein